MYKLNGQVRFLCIFSYFFRRALYEKRISLVPLQFRGQVWTLPCPFSSVLMWKEFFGTAGNARELAQTGN